MITEIYTDAGMIGLCPSLYGGTYAWCGIDENNKMVSSGSGIILALMAPFCSAMEEVPQDACEYPEVEINYMELVAIAEGLKNCAPAGWKGKLGTDSGTSVGRINGSFQSWNGVPDSLKHFILERFKVCEIELVHLSGHGNKEQQATGFCPKGRPYSEWNRFCDKECKRLSKMYQKFITGQIGVAK